MADQNFELVCRPQVAMWLIQKGLKVLEKKKQDEIYFFWPSTNLPIPGTGVEALR